MAHASRRGGNMNQKPKSTMEKKTSSQKTQNQAVVPRGSRTIARHGPGQADETVLAPTGYTMRPIQPAKNYNVISFARAMNDDFGPKVKKLFDPEREAALDAQETGVYVGWRCPEFKWDCQRVGQSSKCFCGHLLAEHNKYNGQTIRVPCHQPGCGCKAFAWVPSRPEDVGEYWLPKRRDFDPVTWRMKCRCKHTHEDHDVGGQHRCHKCGCGQFSSSSVCAACDQHWEQHETFFESERERKDKGLPYGEDYLPFAEIPSLRNMVLTGEDDGDMSYMRLQERQLKPGTSNLRALPPSHGQHPSNDQNHDSSVVPYRAGPRREQGRYSEYSGGQQDYRSHLNQGIQRHANQSSRNAESGRQRKRGGFQPTYD